jgi:hypothetical protein
MRLSFLHVLVALLIAAFALGAPLPAEAGCAACVDCATAEPAKNPTPCPEKGLVCQVAPTCATQLQKMPAQAVNLIDPASGKAAFGEAGAIAIKLAFVKPETSPPRS